MQDLGSLIKRLHAANNSLIAQQAAAGIFHCIAQPSQGLSGDAKKQAIGACLAHPSKEVVQEAVDRLHGVVAQGLISSHDASDTLLTALAAASPACACVLGHGLCQLQFLQASQDGACSMRTSSAPKDAAQWSKHPLSAAVLLNASCAAQMVHSCMGALRSEHNAAQSDALWAQLHPFFSFLLLQGAQRAGGINSSSNSYNHGSGSGPTPSWGLISQMLHAQLVRLGCCYMHLSLRVLQLLVASLQCLPLASETDSLAAASRIPDVLDLLELCLEPTGPKGSKQPPAAAVTAAHELCKLMLMVAWELLSSSSSSNSSSNNSSGGSAGAQSVLDTLVRLQHLAPDTLAPHAPMLALLALGCVGAERQAAYVLLHGALTAGVSTSADAAALLLYPILGVVAYGTTLKSKGWASGLLQVIQDVQSSKTQQASDEICSTSSLEQLWISDACLLRRACAIAHQLWKSDAAEIEGADGLLPGTQPAIQWLTSLEASIQHARAQQAAAKAAAGATPFSLTPADVAAASVAASAQPGPVASMLLGALMAHPDAAVQAAAAAAVRELVLFLPQASLAFLPLVLYCLQRSCSTKAAASGAAGISAVSTAAAHAALLSVLPAMTADASIAPFALRALQPLLQPDAPLLLQCIGMRLVVESWVTTGKGWLRAEAALLGCIPPEGSSRVPLELRLARAALCEAVCTHDPHCGVDLVAALQDALRDPSPAVAALGLQALRALCVSDVLDFYKAWRVMHRSHPALPRHPLTAAAWVGLLSAGALDAEVYPERAAAAIEALWAATRHPSPRVREEAYRSLAAYPPDLLEQMEIDRPLSHYVQPLVTLLPEGPSLYWECDAPARAAAEKLARLALDHEHANRRRFLSAATAATASSAPSATTAYAGAGGAAAGPEEEGEGGGEERRNKASSARGSSTAAAAREAASVRHRLLSTLPPALSAAAATASGTTPARLHAHPGATLLCGRTPVPPGSTSGKSSTVASGRGSTAAKEGGGSEEQAQAMHAAWAVRMEAGLRGMGANGAGTGMGAAVTVGAGLEHASVQLAVRSWAAFFGKWVAQAGGDASAAWSSLQATWEAGGVCEAAAAPLAAAGLLAVGSVDAQKLQWLVGRLESQVHDEASSSAALAAALWGMAHAACHSHPTDHTARAIALSILRAGATARLHPGRGHGPISAAAAPTVIVAALGGLALLVRSCLPLIDFEGGVVAGGRQPQSEPAQVASQALALLLSVVVTVQPQFVEPVFNMVAGLPPALQPMELMDLDLAGLSTAGPDASHNTGTQVSNNGDSGSSSIDHGTYRVLAAALHALADAAGALAAATGAVPGAGAATLNASQPLLLQLFSLVSGSLREAVGGSSQTLGASTSSAAASATPAAAPPSAGMAKGSAPPQGLGAVAPPHWAAAVHALPVLLGAMDSLGWQACMGTDGVLGPLQQLATLASQPQAPGGLRGGACWSLGLTASLPGTLQLLSSTAPPESLLQAVSQLVTGVRVTGGSSTVVGSSTAPATVVAAVVEVLACVAGGEGGVSKGSQAAAARAGAALGLGSLLAGPTSLGSRVGLTSVLGGTPALGGILSMLDDVPQLGKKCVKSLEALASAATPAGPSSGASAGSVGVGAGAGATAAWALAACSAALAALRGTAGMDGAPSGSNTNMSGDRAGAAAGGTTGPSKPLSAYPEDGALRPLVNALTQLISHPSLTTATTATTATAATAATTATTATTASATPLVRSPGAPAPVISPSAAASRAAAAAGTISSTNDCLAAAAATLRCLAAAPRLPAMEFGALCRRLLTAASAHTTASNATTAAAGTLTGTTAAAAATNITTTNAAGLASTSAIRAGGAQPLVDAAVEVQVALVQLMLAHAAAAPSTGLPGLLDEVLGAARFRHLPQPAQVHLLQNLLPALTSLAPSRAAPILTPLPTAAVAAGPAVVAALWEGLRGVLIAAAAAATAAPRAAVTGTSRAPAPEIVTAAREAAVALVPLLPPLPALLPGELAAMQGVLYGHTTAAAAALLPPSVTRSSNSPPTQPLSSKGMSPPSTWSTLGAASTQSCGPTTSASAAMAARTQLLRLWIAAARCLAVARTSDLPAELSSPQPMHPHARSPQGSTSTSTSPHPATSQTDLTLWEPALTACQLRCLIVIAGHGLATTNTTSRGSSGRGAGAQGTGSGPLGARDLVPCRALCADAPEPVASRCRALVSAALVASASQTSQVQVLLETLGLVQLAPSPVGPLRLAASLIRGAADVVCGPHAVLDGHMASTAPGGELASLPFLTPRLLANTAWAASREAVLRALLKALSDLQSRMDSSTASGTSTTNPNTPLPQPQQPSTSNSEQQQEWQGVRGILLATLLSLRSLALVPAPGAGVGHGGVASGAAAAEELYATLSAQLVVASHSSGDCDYLWWLNVKELQEMLRHLGLPVSANKPQLIARLQEAIFDIPAATASSRYTDAVRLWT